MSAHQSLTPAKAKSAIQSAGIGLSEKQIKALCYYISGADKQTAMLDAGYPATHAWSFFQNGKVQAAMAAIVDRFLLVDAAPAALRALYQIVNDEKQAGGVRVQAANSLLDRAGFDAKRHSIVEGSGKDAASMSRDELQAEIERLSREIDGRMRDITPDSAPNDEPITSEVLDMYA